MHDVGEAIARFTETRLDPNCSALFTPCAEFRSSFSMEQLIETLWCGVLPYPYLRVVQEGGPVHPSEFESSRYVQFERTPPVASNRRALECLARGMTVLLNCLDHLCPTVRRFSESLAADGLGPFSVHAVVSPPASTATPPHRDEFDAFHLQVGGSKMWRTWPLPVTGHWQAGPVHETDCEPVLDVSLRPGDGLFIPAGASHHVRGNADVGSVHILVAFYRPQPAELKLYADRIGVQDVDTGDNPVASALLRPLVRLFSSAERSQSVSELRQRAYWQGCEMTEVAVRQSVEERLQIPVAEAGVSPAARR